MPGDRRFVTAGGQNVDILGIVATVASSIVEVFLLCIVGYILSRRGIIDARAKKMLNKLNVSFFTPALMFSKVAFSLTPSKLADLWVIPVLFVVLTAVSFVCAWCLAVAFRVSRSQRNFAISASMFMNSNSLPVALMQSLISTVHRDLEWDSDDSKEKELGRALSYLVVFSTLGLIARWSFGVSLLRASDDADSADLRTVSDESEADEPGRPSSPLLGDRALPTNATPVRSNGLHPDAARHPHRRAVFHSFPNTPRWRTPATSVASSDAESSEAEEDTSDSGNAEAGRLAREPEWGVPSGRLGARAKRAERTKSRARRVGAWVAKALYGIGSFMTPPLYAALLSVIVACIPPLQAGLDRIEPLRGALKSAGNVSVPLTLVVLGAYFNQAPDPEACGQPQMILTPLILLPVLLASVVWSQNSLDDDPCFVVVAVLLIGAPPAVTLAQMTANTGPSFERLVSKSLLISYVFVTPPTTIVLVVLALLIDAQQKRHNGG